MLNNIFFTLLVWFICFYSVNRIVKIFFCRSTHVQKKIFYHLSISIFTNIIVLGLFNHLLTTLLLITVAICAHKIIQITKKVRDANSFDHEYRNYIEQLALCIKSNTSPRVAIFSTYTQMSSSFQIQLNPIIDSLKTPDDRLALTKNQYQILNDLKNILESTHKSLEKVLRLKENLWLDEEVRQKADRLLFQIKAQSYVMTLLYLATFVAVTCVFGFKNNELIILTSVLMYLIGFLWIFKKGKAFKWKR